MSTKQSLRLALAAFAFLFVLVRSFAALGQPALVTFAPSAGALGLAQPDQLAPLVVDQNDWPGVLRAARDLQADVQRVTGREPKLETAASPQGSDVVIIGTIGRSTLIDQLIAAGKVDVSDVQDFPWGRFVFFSDPDGNGWAVQQIVYPQ